MKRTLKCCARSAIALLVALSSVAAEPAPSPTPKPAGGIRTDFGDVLIENLGIGREYNLRDLAGTPLKVTNTGADTVNLVIDVVIPDEKMITPIRRDMGFKPIPSIDWVTLSKTQFVVPAGESAYTDVLIKIPNDPALYGKKFQASIYSRTTGTNFLQLGVWSHLQMTITPSPEAQAQMEKDRKRGFVGSMDYTLLPDKLVLESVPKGRVFDVRKEVKRTMMLANSGNDPIDLKVTVVPIGTTPLTLQSGFEEPADIRWLRVRKATCHVDGASFEDPGLELNLPDDPSLSGKKLMFVVRVEPANPEVVGVTYYGKLYAVVK